MNKTKILVNKPVVITEEVEVEFPLYFSKQKEYYMFQSDRKVITISLLSLTGNFHCSTYTDDFAQEIFRDMLINGDPSNRETFEVAMETMAQLMEPFIEETP